MFDQQCSSAASPLAVAALAVTVGLISLFLSSYTAFAVNVSPNQVSISVSPQSLDTAINPGQSTTSVFRITNGSDTTFTVQPTPKNFVASGNEGAIQLQDDDTAYSLAKWIKVDPAGPVTIEPKQTADFNVTISVPQNADPGGHFGSVVFRTLPSTQPGSGASISQEIAPVILIRVPGNVKEEASITSFRAPNNPVTVTDKIDLELIVKNSGSVHFRPTGTVTVSNMFGKEVAKLDVEGRNVIPNAARKMEASWKNAGFRFGRYTARLTLVYGSGNKILTTQTSFFIVPLKQVVPAIVVTGIVGFILYRIRRRLILAIKILAGKHSEG